MKKSRIDLIEFRFILAPLNTGDATAAAIAKREWINKAWSKNQIRLLSKVKSIRNQMCNISCQSFQMKINFQ